MDPVTPKTKYHSTYSGDQKSTANFVLVWKKLTHIQVPEGIKYKPVCVSLFISYLNYTNLDSQHWFWEEEKKKRWETFNITYYAVVGIMTREIANESSSSPYKPGDLILYILFYINVLSTKIVWWRLTVLQLSVFCE